jgi:3-oxoacyl-[acyl-carrier protein] reductase
MSPAGCEAVAGMGDVTRAADVRAMVAAAVQATGSLDVLVNNAGGVHGVEAAPRFEDLSEEAWHAVLDRNLTGAFLCCQAVIPGMKERGWGRIINIASESARVPIVPPRAGYAYAAAKSGLLGLARVLAAELAPFGITVNTVAPGFTRSGPRIEERYQAMSEEQRRARVQPIKLGRWAELNEIASAVSYLASADASYCVGAVLDVNGGSFMP